ncbi:MAG: phospholipid/cholesterol/gamma-HCH transport system substrate-binding protein [Pseudonocardiales bacterium]|jgi:phospholipid/cholesterol/gamma-HCH transport system substrate-binding protein|nr:phospholipid/cholesterol/gamma-HCH transport system substrate-binding protein [Pseudonocardiales bacterium]
MKRLPRLMVGAGIVLALVTGCSTDPIQSIPLPFRSGTGDGGYTVTVQMAEVTNLVPNAEVKVADVTVGTITSIVFDDWKADLTVSLRPDVTLPANVTARIGQKSLLGAEYLELDAPTTEPPVGTLRSGDTIPLARTSRYPETEEVLAAASTVLNGGGLAQIKTITTELNAALAGREGDFRSLIGNLQTFAGTLDAQKANIVSAIDGLNRLAGELALQNKTLDTALNTIPGGVNALEQNRVQLVNGLDALSQLGDVATRVINGSKDDLIGNLHDLQPALQELADSGNNLTQSMSQIGTFPFPSNTTFPTVIKGDYGNLFITVDLDPTVLARNFGVGFPGGTAGMPLGTLPPLGGGITGGDPLKLPSQLPAVPPPSLPLLPVAPGPVGQQGQGSGAPATTTPPAKPGLLGGLLGGGN